MKTRTILKKAFEILKEFFDLTTTIFIILIIITLPQIYFEFKNDSPLVAMHLNFILICLIIINYGVLHKLIKLNSEHNTLNGKIAEIQDQKFALLNTKFDLSDKKVNILIDGIAKAMNIKEGKNEKTKN